MRSAVSLFAVLLNWAITESLAPESAGSCDSDSMLGPLLELGVS